MGQLNQELRWLVHVTDIDGDPVTGLVVGDFTVSKTRESGATLVAASEALTVAEPSAALYPGDYFFTLTPTAATGLYRIQVSHATHVVEPGLFQEDVIYGAPGSTSGYLTTRANVKVSRKTGTADTSLDSAIDALLGQVTVLCQEYTGQTLFAATTTEYPQGRGFHALILAQLPVNSITSIHVSSTVPRVYGADELLVEGTHFCFDAKSGIVERLDGCTWNREPRAVRVIYASGYDPIPLDLERAAIEIINCKLDKGTGTMYHLTSFSRGDGNASGVRFDDIPENAREVLNRYRVMSC